MTGTPDPDELSSVADAVQAEEDVAAALQEAFAPVQLADELVGDADTFLTEILEILEPATPLVQDVGEIPFPPPDELAPVGQAMGAIETALHDAHPIVHRIKQVTGRVYKILKKFTPAGSAPLAAQSPAAKLRDAASVTRKLVQKYGTRWPHDLRGPAHDIERGIAQAKAAIGTEGLQQLKDLEGHLAKLKPLIDATGPLQTVKNLVSPIAGLLKKALPTKVINGLRTVVTAFNKRKTKAEKRIQDEMKKLGLDTSFIKGLQTKLHNFETSIAHKLTKPLNDLVGRLEQKVQPLEDKLESGLGVFSELRGKVDAVLQSLDKPLDDYLRLAKKHGVTP